MRKLPRFDSEVRFIAYPAIVTPPEQLPANARCYPRGLVLTGADWNALCNRLEMLEVEVANIKYPPVAKQAIGVDHTLTEAKNLPPLPIKPCPTKPPNAPPDIYATENRDQRG